MLTINFLPVASLRTVAMVLLLVTVVATALFVFRQKRAANPLYDLKVAARPTFWVAAVGGIIVFGSLMGAMFISQQFLQDVLGYSTVNAGFAILPAAVFMILVAPRSAKLVEARGARTVLLLGYVFILAAFIWMLLTWNEGVEYWVIGIGYTLVGIGVGLAGTPASRSLTSSVPIKRVGMASGTADLQRDLGGAIMQSILGALLAVGFASAMGATIAASPDAAQIPASDVSAMEASYASAATLAVKYPQYSAQISAAAKESFLAGDQDAYLAGIIAVLIGGALVFFVFPKQDEERRILVEYQSEDGGETGGITDHDILTKAAI